MKNLRSEQKIVFFDGNCNLCNGSVQFILKHEKSSVLQFASLEGSTAQSLLNKNQIDALNTDSIIVYSAHSILIQSDAALSIARELSFPFSLLTVFGFLPKKLRDAVYQFIAKNRYQWFGKTQACWVQTPENSARFLP